MMKGTSGYYRQHCRAVPLPPPYHRWQGCMGRNGYMRGSAQALLPDNPAHCSNFSLSGIASWVILPWPLTQALLLFYPNCWQREHYFPAELQTAPSACKQLTSEKFAFLSCGLQARGGGCATGVHVKQKQGFSIGFLFLCEGRS